MDKKKVDELLPKAYEVIHDNHVICRDGRSVDKAFRGQISTLGAAIINGSTLAAVAFFSQKGQAAVDRTQLLRCVEKLLGLSDGSIFAHIKDCGQRAQSRQECREEVLNAVIALKLALNLFDLKEKKNNG